MREVHKLQMFDIKVLRKISEPEKVDIGEHITQQGTS
jgi:hypothetical protein